jgi:hypothetical protein
MTSAFWVGFRDAFDAIEKYEIVANGITKYTQNFSPEESFITSSTVPESAMKNDGYSRVRHKDIWNVKTNSTNGVFIDPSAVVGKDGDGQDEIQAGKASWNVQFKLKIDIRRFLPLSNIKYLPAFAGKIGLRVMFGTSALVWCPVNPLRGLP